MLQQSVTQSQLQATKMFHQQSNLKSIVKRHVKISQDQGAKTDPTF